MKYIRLRAFYRPELDNLHICPGMFEEIGEVMTIFTKGITATYTTTLEKLNKSLYSRTLIKAKFTALALDNGMTVYTTTEELQILLRMQKEGAEDE